MLGAAACTYTPLRADHEAAGDSAGSDPDGGTGDTAATSDAGAGDDNPGPPPVVIFRSVGPGQTGAIAMGSGNLTVSGTSAMFGFTPPPSVGVGDVLLYDTDADAEVDHLAVIHGRLSATSFTVHPPSGVGPPGTVVASAAWRILRAYTALADIQTGAENTGITSSLRDFDTHTGGRDLVAANETWRVACYGPGPDTGSVILTGWRTDARHLLRIYTPTATTEVGATQRHAGKWTPTAYYLEVSDNCALCSVVSFLRVEGLQVHTVTWEPGAMAGYGIHSTPALGESEVWLSHNIVRASHSGTANSDEGIGTYPDEDLGCSHVWNNLVYDFNFLSASGAGGIIIGGGAQYVYDNTVVNCRNGMVKTSAGGSHTVRNNLVYGSALDPEYVDYTTLWGGVYGANLSSDDTSPDPDLRNQSPAFVDAPNDDFHLQANDNVARGKGINLRADPVLPVNDDIEGDARTGAFDIGADQVAN